MIRYLWTTRFPSRLFNSSFNRILLNESRFRTFYLTNYFHIQEKDKTMKESRDKTDYVLDARFKFKSGEQYIKNRNYLYYLSAFTILVGGCTYLSVLLYRLYCQATGKGGKAVMEEASEKIANMKAVKTRNITVNFNADINSTMRWNFKPQQPHIKITPGETALAFYTAKNPTDQPIAGVATYNVLPFEAGKYFNKIQCFCFEEQQLNPHEEVDLPVFFYLDPEFAEDPFLERVTDIFLSYTFFEAKDGFKLPLPGFMEKK